MNIFGPLTSKIPSSSYLSKNRLIILGLLMLTILGVISARMVELNLIYGRQNRSRADQNRILIKPVFAYRGVILDRHGIVLTRNIPTAIAGLGRIYPFGEALAHAIGYIQSADMAGKTGLEKYYDDILRGQDGAELIEVDAKGQTIRVISEESPISGKDLSTSLDVNLQKIITQKLANRKGAVVAIDPVDGSILALVSSPTFDPNLFQSQNDSLQSDKLLETLNDTDNMPLFNRAISGAYPPGSIFKLVTAAAGLSEKKIDVNTQINDTGEIKIGEFRYGNWYFDQYGRTEGSLNIVQAIARSNDIFFYKVGEWIGADKLSQWAKKFGLGDKLEIDLPAESGGLIPDPVWKERQTGERWFLGNTYHMAIGQGDVQLTPLQAASMVSSVVTGQFCRPHIVSSAIGGSAFSGNSPFCHPLDISSQNKSLIIFGMVGACSIGGTAFPFFSWNSNPTDISPLLACKTGTAQHGGQETQPHAWIAVAGPVKHVESISNSYQLDIDSPQRIVLVVLLESAGEGSAEAGPTAKEILAEWFK